MHKKSFNLMKHTHSKMNRLKSAGKYSSITNEVMSVLSRGVDHQQSKKLMNNTIAEQIEQYKAKINK